MAYNNCDKCVKAKGGKTETQNELLTPLRAKRR